MNTDRELLELAAKAAGLNIKMDRINAEDQFIGFIVGARNTSEKVAWNPLTDDGDALRLAVKLQMMIDHVRHGYMTDNVVAVCRFPDAQGKTSEYESINPDPYAATRRAIVRAAATIGASA